MEDRFQIGKTMKQTMRAMLSSMGVAFHQYKVPLSPDQFILLKIINQYEGIIQQDLADMLRQDKSSILRQINALQERRLVARIPSVKDKRNREIVITKKGSELLEEIKPVFEEYKKQLVNGISEQDLIQLMATLQKIQENAKNYTVDNINNEK